MQLLMLQSLDRVFCLEYFPVSENLCAETSHETPNRKFHHVKNDAQLKMRLYKESTIQVSL